MFDLMKASTDNCRNYRRAWPSQTLESATVERDGNETPDQPVQQRGN